MNLVVTLAFCRPEFTELAIKRFRATTLDWHLYKHIIFDCAYPLPDQTLNSLGLKDVCDRLGVDRVIFPENKGVVGNYGQAAKYTKELYPSAEYLLFFDPDSNPLDPAWAEKTLTVFKEKKCAYVALSRPVPDAPQDSDVETIENIPVKKITRACGWPMGSYEATYLWAIDSWSHDNPYGYGENFMMGHFAKQNRDAYMMMDVVDNGFTFLQADWETEYFQWKVACAHRQTDLGFSQWLQSKK